MPSDIEHAFALWAARSCGKEDFDDGVWNEVACGLEAGREYGMGLVEVWAQLPERDRASRRIIEHYLTWG